MHLVEATGKPQMVILTRTRKELFTALIDREAKRQGLKAVVNGSFMNLSPFKPSQHKDEYLNVAVGFK